MWHGRVALTRLARASDRVDQLSAHEDPNSGCVATGSTPRLAIPPPCRFGSSPTRHSADGRCLLIDSGRIQCTEPMRAGHTPRKLARIDPGKADPGRPDPCRERERSIPNVEDPPRRDEIPNDERIPNVETRMSESESRRWGLVKLWLVSSERALPASTELEGNPGTSSDHTRIFEIRISSFLRHWVFRHSSLPGNIDHFESQCPFARRQALSILGPKSLTPCA